MLCVAVTQGEGRVDTWPAIPVTYSVTWGPTGAALSPHLRGSCRGPREGPGKADTSTA